MPTTSVEPREIVAAHSPDSDDAFMFYGLATKKVRSPKVIFKHVLDDIETLNRRAVEGLYELSAISYLAVPGKLTTAFLACKLFQLDFEPVVTPFDKITEAVREKSVDCGLIIHEAQLTYDREGFHRVVDLGRWFKTKFDLPLPLGGNVLLRSLSRDVQSECCRMMRDSIQYALDNRDEALEYALQFARDMEPRLAEKFVGMYVNHFTLDAGDIVPKAAQKLLDMGYDAGLIDRRVTVEFVR
jgi:1,4-dihydroxy-6-naphthoate synthase